MKKAKAQKKIAKEEKAAKKSKAAKKQKMKLAKEGLDDAAPVLKEKLRKKEVKKAPVKAPAKKKAAKKKIAKGSKIEVKYRMDDGSTQWFEGTVTSERNGVYRVKFPGESGTQRYSFVKSSPHYIEPASWRLAKP